MSKFAMAAAMKRKMAKGGKVKDKPTEDRSKMSGKTGLVRASTEANQNQKGVHQTGYKGSSGGISEAGSHLRDSHYSSNKTKAEHEQAAKDIHHETLAALKSMDNIPLAEGGDVDDMDMVSRIMRKRMSEGGQVANETDIDTADHMPAQYDDLVLRDDLESSYDGANSGDELGNEQEDHDRHDIVARIMRSRAKKDRMPRPA